ncbi:hypothetical protein [Salinivibrio socompensis]|uniref:hypothetical protein n=1 Tax=Salinivibrio socompensis TaxID=1510206 RepID=UPI0004AD9460|nr:hypothetical protein [Salinivibrio socompensis]
MDEAIKIIESRINALNTQRENDDCDDPFSERINDAYFEGAIRALERVKREIENQK